jgi:ferric-dicitrate binding protein FerR (iron transport regulator)
MPENSHRKELQQLLHKYRQGKATAEEARFLESYDAWFDQADYDPVMDETDAVAAGARIYAQLDARISRTRTVPVTRWWAVAAVVLALTATTWLWLRSGKEKPGGATLAVIAGKQPGYNKATLTLSDGSVVALDSSMGNTIADPAGAQIRHLADGRLSYHNEEHYKGNAMAYNTLATPRGGQYQVVLPDGSQVWLNAASSLQYPTAFTGAERKVTITGEAYFKVSQDAKHPFVVQYNQAAVVVLGTEFNIMAYPEEPALQTTLVNGSIRLQQQNRQQLLLPGQMLVQQNGEWTMQQADLEQVTAWKNGYFQFYRAGLPEIMRQLGRWYDIDIELLNQPAKAFEFVGKINRDAPFSLVLKMLKENKVNYKMEGGKLIVY